MESLAILPPDTGEERSDLKQTSMTRTRLRTVDLAYAALFAVLLMVCAWINIPLTVPFTLQTFGVFAALGTLGGRRGTLAILAYLLLGLVGLPVCYAFGTAWFLVAYARAAGPIGLWAALGMCVFPFVVPDLVKLALAWMLSRRLAGCLR